MRNTNTMRPQFRPRGGTIDTCADIAGRGADDGGGIALWLGRWIVAGDSGSSRDGAGDGDGDDAGDGDGGSCAGGGICTGARPGDAPDLPPDDPADTGLAIAGLAAAGWTTGVSTGGGMLGGWLRGAASGSRPAGVAAETTPRAASKRASGGIFCVGATRPDAGALPGPGVVANKPGAAEPAFAPQLPQNRESGSFSVPHVGQRIRA